MLESVALKDYSVNQKKKIKFNKKTIRWPRIWFDSQLKFIVHINEKLSRA